MSRAFKVSGPNCHSLRKAWIGSTDAQKIQEIGHQRCAPIHHTFGPDPAAVPRDDPLHQRQADVRALIFGFDMRYVNKLFAVFERLRQSEDQCV